MLLLNRTPVVLVSALFITACSIDQGLVRPDCVAEDHMIRRDGRSGVEFSNHCRTCVAVGFEYVGGEGGTDKTACFVPSETRVVHWDVQRYRVIRQADCDQVRKDGMRGVAAAGEIMENHRSGTCEMLGVFAD